MSRQDIYDLVKDSEVTEWTLRAMKDIRSFLAFDSVIRTGVSVDFRSLPFEKMMVFGWIKDLINERKN